MAPLHHSLVLLFLSNFLLLGPSSALVTIVSSQEFRGVTLKTSAYLYYGQQDQIYNLSAVFMTGDSVCDHKIPIQESVAGKIVVVRRGDTYCLIDRQYDEIRQRGDPSSLFPC